MKKMSEVFDYPVLGYELEYKISETTGDQDDAIAHAINHVDTLADALESCADLLSRINFESADEYQAAKAALADYRGKA